MDEEQLFLFEDDPLPEEISQEPEPCPFCGCGAKAYQAYDGKWQIECCVCYARSWLADTKGKAIELWNRRADVHQK